MKELILVWKIGWFRPLHFLFQSETKKPKSFPQQSVIHVAYARIILARKQIFSPQVSRFEFLSNINGRLSILFGTLYGDSTIHQKNRATKSSDQVPSALRPYKSTRFVTQETLDYLSCDPHLVQCFWMVCRPDLFSSRMRLYWCHSSHIVLIFKTRASELRDNRSNSTQIHTSTLL